MHQYPMAGERKRATRTKVGAEDIRLLGLEQVVELLGTTQNQVRNMVNRGQLLKPLKVPGLGLRWRAAELLAWIKNLGGETGTVTA